MCITSEYLVTSFNYTLIYLKIKGPVLIQNWDIRDPLQ